MRMITRQKCQYQDDGELASVEMIQERFHIDRETHDCETRCERHLVLATCFLYSQTRSKVTHYPE